MADERGEAGRVFVADIESVLTQLCDGGVHVPRVEEHEGVKDQAEGAEAMIKVAMIRLVAARLAGENIEPHGPIETEAARRLAEDLRNE